MLRERKGQSRQPPILEETDGEGGRGPGFVLRCPPLALGDHCWVPLEAALGSTLPAFLKNDHFYWLKNHQRLKHTLLSHLINLTSIVMIECARYFPQL